MTTLVLRRVSVLPPSVLLCCLVALCGLVAANARDVAAAGNEPAVSPEEAGVSPEELFSRIHLNSVSEFRNAIGYYILRHFDSQGEEKNKETIEALERSLEEGLKARVENDKKFGISADIQQLKAENQAVLDAAKSKYQGKVNTRIERYVVQGGNYRIERIPASNSDPLEKILQDVLAGKIDLSQPQVLAWNGSVTAEIYRSTSPTGEKGESYASVSYQKMAKNPEFMTFGRDARDSNFLATFTKENLPLSTESVMVGDERGIVLRIGDKNTVGLLVEMVALPGKGYVVQSGRVRTAGTVMAEDNYSGFVQVSNGSWLPTRIARSNYRLTKQGVPFLATKREYLAIEPPEVNVELPADVFDLANTEEFQSLRSVSLTEGESTPEPRREEPQQFTTKWAVFLGLIPIVVLAAVGLVRLIRRRRLAH